MRFSPRIPHLLHGLIIFFVAATAGAAMTATPSSVSAYPGQTSPSITLTLTFPKGGNGVVTATGMPPGVSTVPAPITYTNPAGAAGATTTFAFSVGATATPGTYVVTLTDATNGAGQTTVALTVLNPPGFTPFASPNPVTLTVGGAPQQVTVSTTPDAAFNAATISYSFSGFPSFIINDGPQTTGIGTRYGPVTFNFSLAAGATGGTYTGVLTGTASSGVTRTLPFSVVVQQPGIAASFTQPVVQMCNGQTVNNGVTLTPANGYSGSPTLTFTSLPPGITISPLASPKLPPAQTVSFTITANGATSGVAVLNISDPAAGINKSLQLPITITAGDFTPSATPTALTLTAGGATQTVTASIAPTACFAGSVSVTASGQPAGMTIAPATIAFPASASVPISIQASLATAPGTYPITLTFTSGAITRTANVVVTVSAAPDFSLNLTPATLTIQAGSSSTTSATITAINGFSGTATVSAPAAADVTFSPATFSLAPGASATVNVTVPPGTIAGARTFTFTAIAPGVSGTRTATLSISITAAADFAITATPPAVTVRSGETTTVSVAASGSNGFAGTINVVSPTAPGLTFSPQAFTLTAGGSQTVTIAATFGAVAQSPIQAIFTATAANIPPRTAGVLVTVLPPRPPLLTAANPAALVTGTQSLVVRVAGDNFQPGAIFHSDPSLTIVSSAILSPKLADVTLSIRTDTALGPHYLTVTNPDGGVSPTPLPMLVYPPSSIAAPLDVTAAAIVFPARGTMIAPKQTVYPRGLLATTGTGTIIGSWQFDGTPFDRFTVNAAGGMPVEVRANVPIPTSFAGSHSLDLVIESPRHVISPGLIVIDSVESASQLTLLAPRDGAIIRGPEQLFRWSLVPNCTGFDVEVAPPGSDAVPDALVPIARFHVNAAEWRPTAADVAAIGPGIRRWRVRPRCAGETALEPTPWQRFAILPEHVAIALQPSTTDESGARIIRWTSGVTGLLYRVEFLSPAGETLLSALTPTTEYTVHQSFPAGTLVRVSALAPDGSVLGTSSSAPLSRRKTDGSIQLVQQTLIEIAAVEPAEGSAVETPQPHIAAKWKGAAPHDQVTLAIDAMDVTQVATVLPMSIAYDSLIALPPGPHTVTLGVAGVVKKWTFTVGAGAAAAPATAEAGAPPAAEQQRGDWVVAPVGTITLVRAQNREVRAQLSGLTDLNGAGVTNKATGDLSLKHDFRDDKTVQESRNWLGEASAQQGGNLSEMLRVGFAPPDFFDQAQLLSAGIPRGGLQAKVSAKAGVASYYQTFTDHPAGVITGGFGPEQKLKAAAYQIPTNERWDLRLLGLRVEEGAGPGAAGGDGRAFGVFGRFTSGTTLNAIFEAARGDFRPAAGSEEVRRQGNAFRLGLSGVRGTFNYALNVRRTQAEFVNPANRGFTPAGVPDRTGGDLTVGRMMGMTSISVQLRHQQDGSSSALPVPRTRQTGGMVSLTTMFGQTVSLTVSGNTTLDRGEAKPELSMPRTDRNQTGATGTLTEMVGRFNFSQTVSQQLMRDHMNDITDQTITAATLTGGGQVNAYINLNAMLSGTRSAGSSIVGTTDQYLASLQPLIMIPSLFITFQPRASYSTSKNDLMSSTSTSEQYGALATFGPQWFKSLFALQLSADWSRSSFSGEPEPAKFVRRIAATFNLQWRAGAGAAYAAGLMPGTMAVAPPNPAVSTPGAKH